MLLDVHCDSMQSQPDDLNRILVIVPAYQPAQSFDSLMVALRLEGFERILVINDGSSLDHQGQFERAAQQGAVVIEHPVNRGKGAALKTGFERVNDHYSDVAGVVTCDADGQHLVSDIAAVSRAFLQNQSCLILGARAFDSSKVPLRSRFGNGLTRVLFRLLIGKKLTDTQTGLRAIPRSLLPTLIQLKTGKYDFELDMLIAAFRGHVSVQEMPITTVYEDNNALSHFNWLFDSMRIYFVFLRFVMASVA